MLPNIVRALVNLVLAFALTAFTLLALGAGLGVVLADAWEREALDDGSTGRTWAWQDGRPIHYVLEGPQEGPVVALIHGVAVDGLETWRETMRRLTGSGLRVLAVDLPGYGRSTRDPEVDHSLAAQAVLVARLLNAERMQGVTLGGHGWGAAVALEVARTQPQLVGRLALVSPVVYTDPAPRWAAVARIPFLGRAAAWAFDGGGPLWVAARKAGLYKDPATPYAGWQAGADATHIAGTAEALCSVATEVDLGDLPARLGEVRQPVLIIHGSEDATVSQEECVRLQQALAEADLAPIAQAGHLVHVERADQVSRLIANLALEALTEGEAR